MKTLTLEIPDTVNEFDVKMQLAAQLFEKGILSSGQAANLVGISKRKFIETIGKYGVSVFGETTDDLKKSLMDKIIISDTSCLIALTNIGMLTLLQKVYSEVLITKEVHEEYGQTLPDWIIIVDVQDTKIKAELENRLDPGEASSIALALEIENSILIIDEIKGRKIAKSHKLEIIGTIGVLLTAHKQGYIQNPLQLVESLAKNGFRLSEAIIKSIKDSVD